MHTLRLRGLSREILPSDVSLLQSLTAVTHLQLIHTPGILVIPTLSPTKLKRALSINIHDAYRIAENPSTVIASGFSVARPVRDLMVPKAVVLNSGDSSLWPSLHTITMDTLNRNDLSWLCDLLCVPARAKEIKKVRLSRSAARHLSGIIRNGIDDDEIEAVDGADLTKRHYGGLIPKVSPRKPGDCDGEEWLGARVEIENIGLENVEYIRTNF